MSQNVVPLRLSDPPRPVAAGGIQEIPVEKIAPNPRQPRTRFDEADLASLVESIKAVGIVQPIIVKPAADGTFEIVAGERRWRAAIEADIPTIPAIVRPMGSTESLEIALIENIQRAELTAIETALAYKSLLEEHGLTHEEIASKVGRDRTTITNTLRLLKLPPEVQDLLQNGKITEGHARVLVSLDDPARQISLAREVFETGMSVRQLEAKVHRGERGDVEPSRKGRKRQGRPEWRAAEEQLVRKWGRQVKIVGINNGRIEFYFHGLDDLNRLVRTLLG